MKAKPGRKLELELRPKITDEICALFEQGATVKTCCECTGLSESTFFRYIQFGNPDSDSYESTFSEFRERTTRARGKGKARLLAIAWKHAEHDGRIALELLSRIAPREYGKVSAAADAAVMHDDQILQTLIDEEALRGNADTEKLCYLKRALADVQKHNAEIIAVFEHFLR